MYTFYNYYVCLTGDCNQPITNSNQQLLKLNLVQLTCVTHKLQDLNFK